MYRARAGGSQGQGGSTGTGSAGTAYSQGAGAVAHGERAAADHRTAVQGNVISAARKGYAVAFQRCAGREGKGGICRICIDQLSGGKCAAAQGDDAVRGGA